ncbi:MAG: MoaD/ThiS family protein [Candidatus Hydrogenedentes bacterium]|nr:MoaD/ThiS family protein [Candidatus Hydrogenedentota bacterium]
MKVTAKLFATLGSHTPPGRSGNSFEQEIDSSTTVEQLLRKWEIPEDMPLIILVNAVHADRDQVLNDGDILAVFPPIAGG